jgi:hypothetical protein
MTRNIPLIIQRMLERPPILVDEDRTEFGDLFEMIYDDEHPQTTEEWILVADIACVDFEIVRLRSLKVRALHTAVIPALRVEMNGGFDRIDLTGRTPKPTWPTEFRNLMIGVLAGDASAKAAMAKCLEPHGLTVEDLLGLSFARTVSTQLSADRLVDAAYRRRSALYADLERARMKRTRDLPTAADSPSVAPSDGDDAAAAREDAKSGGGGSKPSSADEGHS